MGRARYLKEVRRLDFVARRAWPLLRPLARAHLAPRCKNCSIPSAYAELSADGLCLECQHFVPPQPDASADTGVDENLAAALHDLLAAAEGRGRTYDAIMLFSGGKDSCFTLHRIQKNYPSLRILALLVDNGFMSPIALENAAAAIARFNIDYTVFTPDPAFIRKLFNLAFRQIPEQKGYSIVDMMDGQTTFDSARNLAANLEAPLILCGLNRMQVRNIFGHVRLVLTEEDGTNPLVARHGLNLNDHFTAGDISHWFDPTSWPKERHPRVVLPLVAWNPSEKKILATVERHGLLRPGRSNPLLTNNAFIPIIAISEVAHFGYNSFEIEFARMIREGRIEKPYWTNLFEMIEYTGRTGRFISDSTLEVLRRLGLTKRDVGL